MDEWDWCVKMKSERWSGSNRITRQAAANLWGRNRGSSNVNMKSRVARFSRANQLSLPCRKESCTHALEITRAGRRLRDIQWRYSCLLCSPAGTIGIEKLMIIVISLVLVSLTYSSAARARTSCSAIHALTLSITFSNASPPSMTLSRLRTSIPLLWSLTLCWPQL